MPIGKSSIGLAAVFPRCLPSVCSWEEEGIAHSEFLMQQKRFGSIPKCFFDGDGCVTGGSRERKFKLQISQTASNREALVFSTRLFGGASYRQGKDADKVVEGVARARHIGKLHSNLSYRKSIGNTAKVVVLQRSIQDMKELHRVSTAAAYVKMQDEVAEYADLEELEVVRWQAKVIALQETRLSEASQIELSSALYEDGWSAIWGRPQQPQRRKKSFVPAPWNATHGGVGVSVRRGIPVSRGPIDTPLKQRLWDSGRCVHAMIAYGSGNAVLHVFSVYCFTGAHLHPDAMSKNETFLQDVFEAVAELGNVPVLIMGDFNVMPEQSEILQAAISTGAWRDAAVIQASVTNSTPAATYFSAVVNKATALMPTSNKKWVQGFQGFQGREVNSAALSRQRLRPVKFVAKLVLRLIQESGRHLLTDASMLALLARQQPLQRESLGTLLAHLRKLAELSATAQRSGRIVEMRAAGANLYGILADEAGRLTGNAEEIDDMLQRAWGPIFAMYVDGGEPDWDEFEKHFGEHFRSAVMNVSDITGPELRILLKRMGSGQAAGIEGWRVEELAALPDLLLDQLAKFYNVVEGTARTSRAKGWQELWATSGQHAFRADRSTEDVFWVLALQVEAALLDGRHLYGLKFDFEKCFDRLPHNILLKLVQRMGMSSRILGCPISIIVLSALLSVWARAVEAEVTGVSADTFSDDVGASTYEPASTQLAADLTKEFARLTNQENSIKKSFSFATAVSMDPVFVAGEALQIKRHADVLGASISFDGSTQVVKALVMGKVLFSSSVADAGIMSLQKLLSAIVRALWSKRSRFRCLEIVFTFLAPGRQLDPMWALAHHAFMVAQRMLQRRPELRDMFAAVWRARETERSRLPGPVGKLVAAAKLMGLSWGSAFELRKGDGDTMDVLLSSRGELGHFLREGMRRVCWHRAAERRADMAGLEGVVGVDATVSLLRTRSCEYVHQGILRNILAGSVAFGHPLFKAGILQDDRCLFCSAGCPETALHMFWECPAWQSERDKHPLAIGSYRSDWPNCFKLCRIMAAEVVVYTDGACVRNQHKALRRAGCGAFWGPGHIQNWSAPLRGRCQTNQRAELQAVAHVLQHEARDVHIKSDSEYVVKGFLRHRLAWRALGWRKVSHRDLWQILDELVEARPPGAVRMSKVKGHTTYRDVKAGKVDKIDKTGNDWADFLATTGAGQHAAPEHVVQAAKPVAEDRLSHAFISNVRARSAFNFIRFWVLRRLSTSKFRELRARASRAALDYFADFYQQEHLAFRQMVLKYGQLHRWDDVGPAVSPAEFCEEQKGEVVYLQDSRAESIRGFSCTGGLFGTSVADIKCQRPRHLVLPGDNWLREQVCKSSPPLHCLRSYEECLSCCVHGDCPLVDDNHISCCAGFDKDATSEKTGLVAKESLVNIQRPILLNEKFKVHSYDGGAFKSRGQYDIKNTLIPVIEPFHCSGSGTKFNLLLKCSEDFTMTHFYVSGPGPRCTEPIRSGLVWVTDQPPDVEGLKKYDSMSSEELMEIVKGLRTYSSSEEAGSVPDPCVYFTTDPTSREAEVELPNWKEGRYVAVKFLDTHKDQVNMDIGIVAFIGHFGRHASASRHLGPWMRRSARQIWVHPNELKSMFSSSGWVCDGRDFTGGCRSGQTDFHQTNIYTVTFRCATSGFDLCEKCAYDPSVGRVT
ncbi:unnamed protein product, partial [Polarella glacialis]